MIRLPLPPDGGEIEMRPELPPAPKLFVAVNVLVLTTRPEIAAHVAEAGFARLKVVFPFPVKLTACDALAPFMARFVTL